MDLFEVEDMLWEVMRRLLYTDRKNFSFVNKAINAYYIRKRVGTIYRHGIPIYLGKDELIDQILSSPTRINILIAPPSYGKTIVGLVLALSLVKKDDRLVYIVVPAKCVAMWDDAIVKLCPTNYLVDDPSNSLIINTYDKHSSYSKKGLSVNNRIIITSQIKFRNIVWKNNLNNIPTNANVVIDEAHIGSAFYSGGISEAKNNCYLLSATHIRRSYLIKKEEITTFTVKRNEIENILPRYKLFSSTKSLETLLSSYFSKNNKIVLFTNDTNMVIEKSKKLFSQWKKSERPFILRYRRSPEELYFFHDCNHKILFVVTYTEADIGLSIKAQGAILHEPFFLDARRIHQAISRILRITNNAPLVKIYLTHKKDPRQNPLYIGIRMAAIWVKMNHDITLSKVHYSAMAIKKGMRVVTALGLDVKNLNYIEIMYYCKPGVYILSDLYEKEGLLDSTDRHDSVMALYNKKK